MTRFPEALKEIGIRSVISVEARERFLSQYAKCQNISKAARLARVQRDMVYREAKINPFFAARMQEIMDETLDELEELQLASAKIRSDDRRWVLERARADRWGIKKADTNINVNVRDAREMTDEELEQIITRYAVEAEYNVEGEAPAGGPPASSP